MDHRISLNKYEEDLAYGTLHPSEITACLEDIGGHEEVLRRLRQITNLLLLSGQGGEGERPILPGTGSRLFAAPTGILLYGPPGCGKTLIAKALAKESGVRFLALSLATIMDKWVGETEKYLEALFSLARKIAPVIIFVDEIDALTRKRTSGDREWSAAMKSQLLGLWDGLPGGGHTTQGRRIVIMGATNRPQDIDEAFLRRMPLQIKVDLPGEEQRRQILRIFLADLHLPAGSVDIDRLSSETNGLSGSDLHELCRRTVLQGQLTTLGGEDLADHLTTADFLEQLKKLKAESFQCHFYSS